MITFIIGLLGGASVGIQSPLVGVMASRVGGIAGTFIVHLSGTIISAVLLLSRGGENIGQWRSLPFVMLLAGGFGIFLHVTLSHTVPRLGASAAVTLLIVGQLLTTMVIDHFGLFSVVRPVDITRLIAAALLLVGGYLMVR